jgi:hypothetical protein
MPRQRSEGFNSGRVLRGEKVVKELSLCCWSFNNLMKASYSHSWTCISDLLMSLTNKTYGSFLYLEPDVQVRCVDDVYDQAGARSYAGSRVNDLKLTDAGALAAWSVGGDGALVCTDLTTSQTRSSMNPVPVT